MGGPGDVDVGKIEYLLLSSDKSEYEYGLLLVHLHFQDPICHRLEDWTTAGGGKVREDELPLVWQTTLITLDAYIQKGKFQARGDLMGLLWVIARWRAVDCMRDRDDRIDPEVPVEEIIQLRMVDPSEDRLFWVIQEIQYVIEHKMSRWEQRVFQTRWDFTVLHNRRPSLAELTAVIRCETGDSKLTEEAVKSALQRGTQKVVEHLARKGYSHGR